MANDNNIKSFTAADIEKYHNGKLSAKEMHDLEKAALDDPFLADALEGYDVAGINVNTDIAELKKRLSEKTEQAKVIPLHAGGRSFPWLRAAVLIVLIAGSGLLAYQFLFKSSKDESIAQSKPAENKEIKKEETVNTLTGTDSNTNASENITGKESAADRATSENTANSQEKSDIVVSRSAATRKDSAASGFDVTVSNPSTATSSSPPKTEEKTEYKKTDAIVKQKNEADVSNNQATLKDQNKAKDAALSKKPADKDKDGVTDAIDNKATQEVVVAGYGAKRNENSLYRNPNLFRGRVTDANNAPLPFANITNTRDNVGTYSDAQGNFTLISPDTVMNVQVRSLGFESNTVQLRNYVADNRVLMQEDRSLDAKILDTVKRNISRTRSNTMTLEEPEPEDGWSAYRSYVVNNLNIPETYEMKKSSETAQNTVEVSFEVNKNGDPINIKVEKSLCDKCDKEAVRLIKEGPKWKRKAKKAKRTTVTVPFIKMD